MRNWKKVSAGIAGLLICAGIAGAVTYETVPLSNTDATHFDTIIVLGSPAALDGTPTPTQRERVLEGVREFRAGRAGHIIMTGAAAHNKFVEGEVMTQLAIREGVPAEDVVVEGRALTTVQNMFYSYAIMQQRGWKSAEVVSSSAHIRRAALILEHYDFPWKVRGSEWPKEYDPGEALMSQVYEANRVAKLRWFGFQKSEFLPEKGK